MKKYVLTGGPSSGKSETIEELSKNYFTIKEAALEIIEKEKIFPWDDFEKFQEETYHLQIKLEETIPLHIDLVFLDRCLLDIVSYCLSEKLKIPKKLTQVIKNTTYDKFFFLEMLPEEYWSKTRNGKPRKKTYKQGQEDHEKLHEFYKTKKINLIYIPFKSVAERVELIKRHLP